MIQLSDLRQAHSPHDGGVSVTKFTHAPVVRSSDGGNSWFKQIRLSLKGPDLKQPMAQHAVVYACVHAKASNVSRLPFIVREAANEEGPAQSNPLSKLFDKPNPLMSTQDFFYFISTYLDLSGECIIVKEAKVGRLANAQATPSELWPTDGSRWDIEVDKNTKLITKWILDKDKVTEITYEPWEIIHVRHPNPYKPYRGLAPWSAAAGAAEVDWDAHRYNRAYFKNGADPGGVVSFPKEVVLQPDDRRAYREEWADRHQGPDKNLRTAILDRGATYTSLQSTFRDMQWANQRTWNRYEIMMVFRTPPGVIGIYEQVNYATARQESQDFWTKTLLPIIDLIYNALWQGLFSQIEGGKFVGLLDTSEVPELQEDLDALLDRAKKMADLGWTMEQVNDRLKIGMPINPWQKQAYATGTLIPYDLIAEIAAQDALDSAPIDEGEDEGDEPAPAPDEGASIPTRTRLATAEERAQFWFDYIRTFSAREENIYRGQFRRHFKGIMAEVLTNLEDSHKSKGGNITKADSKAYFDVAKWKAKLAKSMKPKYAKTAARAANRLNAEIGAATGWSDKDPKVKDLSQELAKRVTRVDDTIRRRLSKTLAQGIEAGEGLPELQARVKRVMNASMSRALAIARTEVGGVSSRARIIAMAEEGVAKHMWLSARDSHVRPSHEKADGEVRKIGNKFSNGLRYPHDPAGPAEEIVNCRCLPVPEVED